MINQHLEAHPPPREGGREGGRHSPPREATEPPWVGSGGREAALPPSSPASLHSPPREATPSLEGVASVHGVQCSISLEYQICPPSFTIWYSSNWNGGGSQKVTSDDEGEGGGQDTP